MTPQVPALFTAAVAACTLALGCDALYGIRELSSESGPPATDAAPGDAAVDAGDAGAEASLPLCGSLLDGGRVSPAELEWALWPMPNAPIDVEGGAPNPESYTDNGNGTVTDDVTGLMWEQNATTVWPQSGAINYCQGLTLAGRTDWVLPTYLELASLVDLSQTNPTINPAYFPNAAAEAYWSSTLNVGAPNDGWTVSFANGTTSDRTSTATAMHHARCVSHPKLTIVAGDAGAPCTRYVITTLGPGAVEVTDTMTGLRWQRGPSRGSNDPQSGARTYCRTLDWSTTMGWRLPTGSEILTLVDVTQMGPAVDPVAFPGTLPTQSYWTASPDVAEAGVGWVINMSSGQRVALGSTTGAGVLCVR